MSKITRRKAIGGIGAAITASLAGCTASGIMGPKFEAGDEQKVMLEASWFGDDWLESEEEEENESNESQDDDGVIEELGYDPDEVPTADAMFEDEEFTSIAFALVSILDDSDDAETVVDDYGSRAMVGAEDPDIGDTAARGEVSGVGVLVFNVGNAVVLTGAADIVGFNIEANNLLALEAGEEIEERLNDL